MMGSVQVSQKPHLCEESRHILHHPSLVNGLVGSACVAQGAALRSLVRLQVLTSPSRFPTRVIEVDWTIRIILLHRYYGHPHF